MVILWTVFISTLTCTLVPIWHVTLQLPQAVRTTLLLVLMWNNWISSCTSKQESRQRAKNFIHNMAVTLPNLLRNQCLKMNCDSAYDCTAETRLESWQMKENTKFLIYLISNLSLGIDKYKRKWSVLNVVFLFWIELNSFFGENRHLRRWLKLLSTWKRLRLDSTRSKYRKESICRLEW